MGTTVHIPDELYRQAESIAALEGISVGDLIARGLRLALAETHPTARERIAFPLHHSARPGVLSAQRVRAAEEAAAQQEDGARASTV